MKELTKIQKILKTPKDQTNSFGSRAFKYRTVEGILSTVKENLDDNCGLTLTSETKEVCGIPYVEATARFSNGTKFKVATAQAGIPLSKKGGGDLSQLWGSATTYAKKMALQNLFLLTEDNDPDSQNNTEEEVLTEEQHQEVKDVKALKDGDEKTERYNKLSPAAKEDFWLS